MIVYLHMHKCAGTSVVRAAQASGLRLPAVHKNGNLLGEDQQPVKYRRLTREALAVLIGQQIDAGTQFMAMEWDFPRWAMFAEIAPLRFFTTLRDPLARAISNFRMDKAAGWIDREVPFSHYINGDALYCSDNYYVKMLCQLWPKHTATPADLDEAMAVLAQFEAVIVVEQGNMAQVLPAFGIAPPQRRFNSFDAARAQAAGLSEFQLCVSQAEIREFIDRNALDYALYRHFTRAIRQAARADRSEPALG